MEYKIEEEEGIDVKGFINKVIANWYWFVVCGFIGLALGFGFNRISQEEYELKSLVLAEENKKSSGIEEMFSGQLLGSKTNIVNHIGILSSYSIVRQTLINLNWRVYWYKEKYLKHTDLYNNAPFKVTEVTDYLNISEIPLYITNLTDSTYQITVDDEVKLDGKKINIEFKQNGKYGELFSNSYFNFTIEKADYQLIDSDYNYYFVFKDLNWLTLSYQEKLDISAYDEESDLIQLKIIGNQPERESDFLNQLAEVYINFGLRKKNQISENTIKFIDRQLGGIVDSLQTAGDDFTDFRSRNRIVDLNQEAGLVVEQLKELEYEESMATMRYDYYKNLQKYLGDAKQMELMVAPSVVGITDPSLNSLVVKLSELYSRRSAISSSLTKINPARIAIENEISYTKQILDENLKSLLSNVNVELQNFKQRKSTLNSRLTVLPKTEQNLINYKRKFDINNELYTFLMQKSAEAAITKASNISDIQVLDYASLDTATLLGPVKKINMIFGLIFGLIVPFLVIIVKDYFNNTINSKEEIEKNSDIPVVGSIIRNKLKTDLPIIKYPHTGLSESIRALRTNLHFLLSEDDTNVISIHSSIPGEGKSFLSANLAASIALNHKKVLLVCTDLRKPRIHEIFDKQNKIGLSTFLIGKNSFEEIVSETSIKNLFFTSSGPIPPNPSELLGTDNFKSFIKISKNRFDYVIFDNAPAFMVTDPIIVGNQSDINLFVLRQNFTNKDSLTMINQLQSQGTLKNIYLLFNSVKSNNAGYNRMYGQGYGNFNSSNIVRNNMKKSVQSPVES